jgi:RNA polymerase sigma-70 factor (ECF subfamily)
MTTLEFESSINNAANTLHPMALQLTRDVEDAKDLLQVTFMKAWANKHRFTAGTNLKAWLYTIMKNTFFSEYRRKSRQKTYVDLTENQHSINSSDTRPNGAEAHVNLNLMEIRSAIDELPDVYRLPFKLFLEGFKYEEISEKYNLPLGTVKNRIFLARKELQERLRYLIQDSLI